MAIFNMTGDNSVGKFLALGAVAVVVGVGLFVLNSDSDTDNIAVTETVTEVQATTAVTDTPVEPINNSVSGPTTTGTSVNTTPVPDNIVK
jgi:hypothetical protein